MSEAILSMIVIGYRYPGAGWRLEVERLEVSPGERVGIIGPNGSGKSTLLKIAAGVLRPDSGRVFQRGTELEALERREIARRIAYLPQTVSSMLDFTVEEVVRMGRYPHLEGFGRMRGRHDEVVEATLDATGLVPLRTRPLSRLSGGEYKRVLLASVLAQEPEVLLLDEPTAALDVEHQVRLHRLFVALSRKGMAVVAVTHDLNLASLFFRRLLLLEHGKVSQQGSPGEVLTGETMERVYGAEVLVHRHPLVDCPMVLPRP